MDNINPEKYKTLLIKGMALLHNDSVLQPMTIDMVLSSLDNMLQENENKHYASITELLHKVVHLMST